MIAKIKNLAQQVILFIKRDIAFMKPYIKQALLAALDLLVCYAELKFPIVKAGSLKKSFVIKETYDYINQNPQIKADLLKMYGDRLDQELDKLIEKSVNKLINSQGVTNE